MKIRSIQEVVGVVMVACSVVLIAAGPLSAKVVALGLLAAATVILVRVEIEQCKVSIEENRTDSEIAKVSVSFDKEEAIAARAELAKLKIEFAAVLRRLDNANQNSGGMF